MGTPQEWKKEKFKSSCLHNYLSRKPCTFKGMNTHSVSRSVYNFFELLLLLFGSPLAISLPFCLYSHHPFLSLPSLVVGLSRGPVVGNVHSPSLKRLKGIFRISFPNNPPGVYCIIHSMFSLRVLIDFETPIRPYVRLLVISIFNH